MTIFRLPTIRRFRALARAAAAAACIAALSHAVPGYALTQPGTVLWETAYTPKAGSSAHARGLSLDDDGNLFVTGYTDDVSGNHDFLTVKYGPYGSTEWIKLYDFTWNDVGRAVAASSTGNAIVAGASDDMENPSNAYVGSYYSEYRIVKYDPEGDLLFEMKAAGFSRDCVPYAIVVDDQGGIYVTGTAKNAPDAYNVFYTVKFDPAGELLWERVEDPGSESESTSIALAPDGSVVVAGHFFDFVNKTRDIRVLRYDPDDGSVISDIIYDNQFNDDTAWGVAVDRGGSVIVTGQTVDPDGTALTVKFAPDGKLSWVEIDRKAEYVNRGNAVAVDGYDRIYVAGTTRRQEGGSEFMLLVYGPDGKAIDSRRYPDGENGSAEAVAIDMLGNIVVAGTATLQDETSLFRTLRLEGYPLERPSKITPGVIFDKDAQITLFKPVFPMLRVADVRVEALDGGSPGGGLIFWAETTCIPGECEYRFLMNNSINKYKWREVKPYSDSNSWVYTPSPDTEFARIKVQVRSKGSLLEFEAMTIVDLRELNRL